MSTDKTPDTAAINAYVRSRLSPAKTFTIVQDGRSGEITTTTADGETYTGRDGVNDAMHHVLSGAAPRNRRADDGETGGAA